MTQNTPALLVSSIPYSQNVVQSGVRNIYTDIQTFLRDKGLNSENTKDAYGPDIRDFFAFTRGKALESLTVEDLEFDHNEVLDYRIYLIQEKKYAYNSVNRKMFAIKACMTALSRHKRYGCIRAEAFQVDELKGNANSYGELSFDEVVKMCELVQKQVKGKEKALLIELAAVTSFRLTSMLEGLKWSDFEDQGDKVIVSVVGKGKKKDAKPIKVEFYHRLLMLKKEGKDELFTLSKKTCNLMIVDLCEQMGIPKSRNIVFHSLKNVAINWVFNTTGDIVKAARQGNHGIETAHKNYLSKQLNFDEMAGLNMGEEIDLSVLDGLTKEQLLAMIGKSKYATKMDMLCLFKQMV